MKSRPMFHVRVVPHPDPRLAGRKRVPKESSHRWLVEGETYEVPQSGHYLKLVNRGDLEIVPPPRVRDMKERAESATIASPPDVPPFPLRNIVEAPHPVPLAVDMRDDDTESDR